MSASDVVDSGHSDDLPSILGTIPLSLTAPVLPSSDIDSFLGSVPHMSAAMRASGSWQAASLLARFRESAAVGRGVEVGRVYELIRYQAAVGETLAMACCSGMEVARWGRHRAHTTIAVGSNEAACAEMAHRAVAELQSHFLISAGHGLINVTARALALESDLRIELLDIAGSGFAVGGTDRRDFLSINPETARGLRKVARRAKPQLFKGLADPVAELSIDSAWQAMVESRGEHFHRVRAQSHGVAGLSAESPWTFGENFRSMDFGWPLAYSDTKGLADTLMRVNQEALGSLAGAMQRFLEVFEPVLSEAGSP